MQLQRGQDQGNDGQSHGDANQQISCSRQSNDDFEADICEKNTAYTERGFNLHDQAAFYSNAL